MKNKSFFTIPNILTLLRIVLIPLLVFVFFEYYEQKPFLPAVIFAVAAITDLFDGFIAKRFNMISDAGKVLDPLADKLFLNTMLLCFVIKAGGLIITLLLIINVVKEIYLITAGTLLYKRKFILSSKFIGKAATFVLNLGIIFYFFVPYLKELQIVAESLFVLGLVLSLSSAVYYTVTVYKQTGGRLPPKS
jgi:cardiolipin synthase